MRSKYHRDQSGVHFILTVGELVNWVIKSHQVTNPQLTIYGCPSQKSDAAEMICGRPAAATVAATGPKLVFECRAPHCREHVRC